MEAFVLVWVAARLALTLPARGGEAPGDHLVDLCTRPLADATAFRSTHNAMANLGLAVGR